ncbi:Transcriptional regulator, LysR family [Pararobbsia alpina]|uniref:LysR family transcriptional regulator n=1 Tax=Pararobbsia alpina TaxID=621374 RepID=UPI0039A5B833
MESIAAFNIFVLVAETRSFVDAGRQLGVSASAIGKSISRLEQRLGARLFHRSTRSVTLTAEGELFLVRSRRILKEVADAQAELTRARLGPSGRLKIGLPLVGEPFFDVIASFKKAYPDIDLEISFSDRPVDVIEEGFDAVIRSGRAQDSLLKSRALGSFTMMLAASPDYLDARGRPQTVHDLETHACIRFRFSHTGKIQRWPLSAGATQTYADSLAHLPDSLPASIVCNNLEARIAFAIKGAGIAYLPDFAIAPWLGNGQLEIVLPQIGQRRERFYILWPSGTRIAPKLRAFIDFLAARLFREDAGEAGEAIDATSPAPALSSHATKTSARKTFARRDGKIAPGSARKR